MFKNSFILTVLLVVFSTSAFAKDFSLSSTDISEGQQLSNKHVFNSFGCTGESKSPQLSWSGAPDGAKSFAITAYDPDAPTGSGWWHWVSFDISKETNSLERDASANGKMPKGAIQSKTDFGFSKFGGACPPPGEVHRYVFTVYALDVDSLGLDQNATPALVGFMINSHKIDSAKITAIYTR